MAKPAHELPNTDGTTTPYGYEVLLSVADVALIFRVNRRTVTKWADRGLLRCYRAPNGHRRFPEDSVRALFEGRTEDAKVIPENPVHIYVNAQ